MLPFRTSKLVEMRKDARKKEHFSKVKIKYSPDDADSESYQVLFYKHANGGPIEFIEFYRAYLQCKRSNALTLGPACCRLAESLLRGAWLRIFKAEMLQRGSETVANVTETMRIWGRRIFGPRAVQRQKWYLRSDDECRKQRGEHIREWAGRMEQHIADFELVMPLSLDDADRVELLLRAVPAAWLRELYMQGKRPEELDREEALDLFERLETAESITVAAASGRSIFERPVPRPTLIAPRNDQWRRPRNGNDPWRRTFDGFRPRQQNRYGGRRPDFRAANREPARIITGQASRRAVRELRDSSQRRNARAGHPSLNGNRNYRYGARQYGSLEESGRDSVQPAAWDTRNQRPRGVNRNNTWHVDNPVEARQRQQREDAARANREAHAMQRDGNASEDSDVGF